MEACLSIIILSIFQSQTEYLTINQCLITIHCRRNLHCQQITESVLISLYILNLRSLRVLQVGIFTIVDRLVVSLNSDGECKDIQLSSLILESITHLAYISFIKDRNSVTTIYNVLTMILFSSTEDRFNFLVKFNFLWINQISFCFLTVINLIRECEGCIVNTILLLLVIRNDNPSSCVYSEVCTVSFDN